MIVPSTKPSLTVFLPNLNHVYCIAQSIEAILKQSRPPTQFIIVDDASKDDSVKVIESYAKTNACIKLIQNKERLGVVQNYANVLASIETDYFYAAAADDMVEDGFFEEALTMAGIYPHAGIIFGKMRTCDMSGKELMMVEVSKWTHSGYYSPKQFMDDFVDRESPLRAFGCTTIYNTNILKGLRPERFQNLDHWYDGFLGRVIGLRHGACYIPKVLAHWTMRTGSMSQSVVNDKDKSERIIQASIEWMRSEEFSDIFPEEHIEKWSNRYRQFSKWYGLSLIRRGADIAQSLKGLPIVGSLVQSVEKCARKYLLDLKH
jgi:glycosyltransferase involved in cell wall biosynthesis